MSFHPIPVENTPLDRSQIATVLVTANYEDAYYRTIYSSLPLPFLIEKARLRLGSNLLSPKGRFMKIVDQEPPNGELGNAEAGKGNIVSYAKWMLPLGVKEKLESRFPREKLSLRELEELESERKRGCGPDGDPKGL